MLDLKWDQVLAYRLARHHLDRRLEAAPDAMASAINGFQAQVMSAAELSAWTRVAGLAPGAVSDALWTQRSLVKTWAMRGTLHLLSALDLPLVMAAVRNRSASQLAAWLKYVNQTPEQLDTMNRVIGDVLRGRNLTRAELIDGVASELGEGLREAMSSGWGVLLKPAARQGLLCFGPSRGQSVTFVRADEWVPWQDLDEEEAISRLLRRYLHVNGPATRHDFERWLGVRGTTGAWNRLRPELVEARVAGSPGYVLGADVEAIQDAGFDQELKLLPHFDHYLLTHIGRDHLVPPMVKSRVFRTAGWVSPVVLIRGRVAGVWGLEGGRLVVEEFTPLRPAQRRAAEREAALLAEFQASRRAVRD